jgi:hypothetical protein
VVELREPSLGEVERGEARQVRAHVDARGIVVSPERLLVRVPRVEEQAQAREQQLRAGELVVPAEHGEVEHVGHGLEKAERNLTAEVRSGGDRNGGALVSHVLRPVPAVVVVRFGAVDLCMTHL